MPKPGNKPHKKTIKLKGSKNSDTNTISIKNLALCLILSIILVIALTFILALISVNSSMLDEHLAVWEISAIAIALLIGGFVCGRRNGSKGLYNGLILGALFAVVILIFSVSNQSFHAVPFMIKTATALVSSAIGGIVGVK